MVVQAKGPTNATVFRTGTISQHFEAQLVGLASPTPSYWSFGGGSKLNVRVGARGGTKSAAASSSLVS